MQQIRFENHSFKRTSQWTMYNSCFLHFCCCHSLFLIPNPFLFGARLWSISLNWPCKLQSFVWAVRTRATGEILHLIVQPYSQQVKKTDLHHYWGVTTRKLTKKSKLKQKWFDKQALRLSVLCFVSLFLLYSLHRLSPSWYIRWHRYEFRFQKVCFSYWNVTCDIML